MVRVKLLRRDASDHLRETKYDIHKVSRNYDPELHPFDVNREYVRASNAVKLEKVFAKPFLGALDGHGDAITCLAAHPERLSRAASGAGDGEVRLWDLARKKCVRAFKGGHDGRFVRGITFTPDGNHILSVGDDKNIVTWKTENDAENFDLDGQTTIEVTQPLNSVTSKNLITGITHHRHEPLFATCGESTQLWDSGSNFPLKTLQWGVDTVHAIKFNQVEPHILAACASDRSIILYDTRLATPMRKVIMELKTNAIAWNPMEAPFFVAANEDYNVYAFDMRNLNRPKNVHCDHIAAVTCVDFAPTGKEFVTGGYDKTVRIFPMDKGHSREVYHTKRMQRLTCVTWSGDNRYILSGSDEMNVRLWKARASEQMGLLKERQRTAINYSEKLKEKFQHHPQIKRIARHKHVPKHVLNAQKEHRVIKESQKRKEANRRAHSKPGSVPYVSERDKHVIEEKE